MHAVDPTILALEEARQATMETDSVEVAPPTQVYPEKESRWMIKTDRWFKDGYLLEQKNSNLITYQLGK